MQFLEGKNDFFHFSTRVFRGKVDRSVMNSSLSFQEILREKLALPQDKVSEKASSSREKWGTDPLYLGFLLGLEGKKYWEKNASPAKLYKVSPSSPPTRKKVSRPSGRPHCLNPEQQLGFDFFAHHGETLEKDFTPSELRTAYRRLALKMHPDRQGSTSLFIELKKNFDLLEPISKTGSNYL